MLTAKFVRPVLDACEAALIQRGFRRLRRHDVVLDLSEDFLGWVGLNYGVSQASVRINPFIGVHCVPVMKLIESLSGSKYQLGRYATFAVGLGEVSPHAEVVEFSSELDLKPESERLAQLLWKQAAPYMAAHASYEAMLPLLVDRVPMLGGYPQRVAATLYLMGRREEARQFVLARRAEYESDEVVVRESFNRFALSFLKLFAN